MKNILVIFGGKSSEYEVSLMSACSVLQNMDTNKYNVIKLGITKDGKWLITKADPEKIKSGDWIDKTCQKAVLSPDRSDHGVFVFEGERARLEKIDAIFPVMHGDFCEDGCIQGLFELSGIPYVGASVLASAVCMDKSMAKLVFAHAKIPQAGWVLAFSDEIAKAVEETEKKFSYPVFVKPCNAGSSFGTGKALNRQQLESALRTASQYDNKILIEEYICGREIECAVLGNENPKASVVGEITPSNEFYDYAAKYIDNSSVLTIPASLPKDVSEEIRRYAIEAYIAAGCKGLSRVDFFVHRETGEIYLNEINTLPGFTSISMYPKLWIESGISYKELIDRLLDLVSTTK